MDTLYTFWDNITHYKTKSVHFLGLMNSATKKWLISHLIGVITVGTLPVTLFVTTHEPPSRSYLSLIKTYLVRDLQKEIIRRSPTVLGFEQFRQGVGAVLGSLSVFGRVPGSKP